MSCNRRILTACRGSLRYRRSSPRVDPTSRFLGNLGGDSCSVMTGTTLYPHYLCNYIWVFTIATQAFTSPAYLKLTPLIILARLFLLVFSPGHSKFRFKFFRRIECIRFPFRYYNESAYTYVHYLLSDSLSLSLSLSSSLCGLIVP